MKKFLIQGVIALLILGFSLAGFWLEFFADNALQILGVLLSIIFSFIIFEKFIEEKKEDKIDKKLEAITSALIEKFKNKEEMDSHYVKSVEKANRVEDLTWAPFDRAGKEGAVTSDYVKRIRGAAENGTDFDEIFIFNNQNSYRQDRLAKLKFHYENASKNKRNNRYSCYYIDTKTFDFPRIQFTIIDEEEIIFTSGRNTRFRIKNKDLVYVFSDYYKDSINKSTPLIENGEIADKELIEKLLTNLKK